MRNLLFGNLLLGFAIIAFAAEGLAATIHVPGNQPTIQSGIDAAQDRDTVLVAPGTYYEHFRFDGKEITVESSAGAVRTFIDGSGYGPVARFEQMEGRFAILSGFTITNGKNSIKGGGILCDGSSPQIIENIISENTAKEGSGIYCIDADPLIKNNHIHHNCDSITDTYGGGIFCVNSSPVVEKIRSSGTRRGCPSLFLRHSRRFSEDRQYGCQSSVRRCGRR